MKFPPKKSTKEIDYAEPPFYGKPESNCRNPHELPPGKMIDYDKLEKSAKKISDCFDDELEPSDKLQKVIRKIEEEKPCFTKEPEWVRGREITLFDEIRKIADRTEHLVAVTLYTGDHAWWDIDECVRDGWHIVEKPEDESLKNRSRCYDLHHIPPHGSMSGPL